MGCWTDYCGCLVGKTLAGKCIKTDSITQIENCPCTLPLIQKALEHFTGEGYEGEVQTYFNTTATVKKIANKQVSYLVIEFYVEPEDYDRDIITSNNKISIYISTNFPTKAEFIEALKKFSKVSR